MEKNLFTNTQPEVEKDYYKEMLERRTRPVLNETCEEETGMSSAVDKKEITKSEERVLESYPFELVLEKAMNILKRIVLQQMSGLINMR